MIAMRKFLICVSLMLLPFCLSLGGCVKRNPLIEGEYVSSDKIENPVFPKIKLELYHLNAQSYAEANGKNVICDVTQSGDEKYFSFDLYLYIEELNEYRKLDVNEFEYMGGSPQIYHSYSSDESGYSVNGTDYKITQISFEYQSQMTIVIYHNDGEYSIYNMLFVNNY